MTQLQSAVVRLSYLLTPPVSYTNGPKIFLPDPEKDTNVAFKTGLISQANLVLDTGLAVLAGDQSHQLSEFDDNQFDEIDSLLENDLDKGSFSALVNAVQAVVVEVNRTTT